MWWIPHPFSEILFYQGTDGHVPITGWLNSLPLAAREECLSKIEQLTDTDSPLLPPDTHYLRDGIHCLRTADAGLLYRVFYFELSHRAFVISHGCIGGNLEWETERAILHRRILIRHPGRHLCKPTN